VSHRALRALPSATNDYLGNVGETVGPIIVFFLISLGMMDPADSPHFLQIVRLGLFGFISSPFFVQLV